LSTKNTLYISYDGMTDPLGQSQVLPYLCGLSKKGYRISLISAEKPHLYTLNKSIIEKICAEYEIKWHPIKYTKSPPILGTLLDINKIKKIALKLHKSQSFSLVHCRSYIPSIIGLFLKKKYKIPFIFDMRGFWVDEKVDGKIWKMANPLYRFIFYFMKQREKDFFKTADRIISLTNKAIPVIQRILEKKENPQNITVIPCCVDVNHFSRNLADDSIKRNWENTLGITEKDYILCYLGSLSTWYLPKEMLLFFKTFQKIVPHAKFLIITAEEPDSFLALAKFLGVDVEKLIFTSSKRKELPALLSICNSSVFFIKPAFSKIASSPTKLGELLSMGIPVICNTGIGDTDEKISASQSGVICNSFDEDEYKRCTLQLLKIEKEMDVQLIREKAIELFNLENGVDTYANVYQELVLKNDDKAHSLK